MPRLLRPRLCALCVVLFPAQGRVRLRNPTPGGHDACAAHFVQRSPMPISLHSRSDRVIYQVINQKAYTEFAGMQT
jgi:hypothetical protein